MRKQKISAILMLAIFLVSIVFLTLILLFPEIDPEYEDLGEVAQIFLFISLISALATLVYRYRDLVLKSEKYQKYSDLIRKYYRISRPYLLIVHVVGFFVVIAITSFHGFNMLFDNDLDSVISGIVLYASMFIISVSGFVVYFRLYHESKTRKWLDKYIHKSKLSWALVALAFLLHGD